MSKFYASDAKALKYTELFFDSRDFPIVGGANTPTDFEYLLNKPLVNIVRFQLWEVSLKKTSANQAEDGEYCHVFSSLQCSIPKASTNTTQVQSYSLGKVQFPASTGPVAGVFTAFHQYDSNNFTENIAGPQTITKLRIKLVLNTGLANPGLAPTFNAGSYFSGTIRVWSL